ncbi:MAG TPA: DoxX family protein [Caldilineaceae bacterium]|nr:DoxX family protein [Caldilineaceae bacterium]
MYINLALLVLRVVVGIIVVAHGAQKVFGVWGGPGMAGFTGWLASMRLKPAPLWAWLAALAEFGGGILMILGLLNPLGPLAVAATMLMAIIVAHWPKFFASNQGLEFPLALLAVAVAIVLTGPGAYSFDAVLGIAFAQAWVPFVGLLLVVVGIIAAFATRAPATA